MKSNEEILKNMVETITAIANEHYPNRDSFKEAITTLGKSRKMSGKVLTEFVNWALSGYDSQIEEFKKKG